MRGNQHVHAAQTLSGLLACNAQFGTGEGKGVLADVQNGARGLSAEVGQAGGKTASKGMRWFVSGNRNADGSIASGGYLTKLGKGIQGGWNKFRGKN